MHKRPIKIFLLLFIAFSFASCAGKKPGGGGGGGGGMGGGGGCRAGKPEKDGERDIGLDAPGLAAEGDPNVPFAPEAGLGAQADPIGFTPQPGVGIVPGGVFPGQGSDFTAPLVEPGADFLPAFDSSTQKVAPPGGRLDSLNDPNNGRGNETAPQKDPTAVQTVRLDLNKKPAPTTH